MATISIVVAACNEGGTIELVSKAFSALIIPIWKYCVNDRSTDNTKEVIAQFNDSRLRVIHIETLPEGWLGKVHALHIGTQHTSGEWVLYTDADVQFSPNTVKKTISMCLEKNIDHLTLLPRMYSDSF